jgi:predicted acylesterase/phospholipase RssA
MVKVAGLYTLSKNQRKVIPIQEFYFHLIRLAGIFPARFNNLKVPCIRFIDSLTLCHWDNLFYILIFMRIDMKKAFKASIIFLILLVLIYVGLVLNTILARPGIETPTYHERKGTAIVITGAASRIAQEAALLEQLHKTGWFGNVCFISGTSSGALNTVVLNAILENKISWKRYDSILFRITNDDIFIRTGRSLPVDNTPYCNLLTRVINEDLGYKQLGDLPIQSAFSILDISALPPHSKTYRLSNVKINDESNPNFNLVEALIASSAIPFIFPAARFKEPLGLPNSSFVDGGLGEDHLPVESVLQYEKYRNLGVDTLIIVSRKCDTKPGINDEIQNFGNNDSKIQAKLGLWLENIAKNNFIKSMKEIQKDYPELAARTYVYIPDFPENFPLLDFNHMKEQYEVTSAWARSHKPVKLDQYLAENEEERNP